MTPFCMLFDIVFTLIVDLNVVITFVSLSTMTAQPHAGMMGWGGVSLSAVPGLAEVNTWSYRNRCN